MSRIVYQGNYGNAFISHPCSETDNSYSFERLDWSERREMAKHMTNPVFDCAVCNKQFPVKQAKYIIRPVSEQPNRFRFANQGSFQDMVCPDCKDFHTLIN